MRMMSVFIFNVLQINEFKFILLIWLFNLSCNHTNALGKKNITLARKFNQIEPKKVNNRLKILICTANIYQCMKSNANKIFKKIKNEVFDKNFDKFDIFCLALQEMGFNNIPQYDALQKAFPHSFIVKSKAEGLENVLLLYSKNEKEIKQSSLSLPAEHTPRSAAILEINKKIKICSAHLFGGRYEDKYWYKNPNSRDIQIDTLIKNGVNIIAGDFNTSNKIGDLDKYWKTKLAGQKEEKLKTFLCSPHTKLINEGYISMVDETKIKKTTIYAEKIVDWIYVQKALNPRYIDSFKINSIDEELSDHDFVCSLFEIELVT